MLPPNVWIALSVQIYSDAATGSALTEVATGAYLRVALANTLANWPTAVGGVKSNAAVITFPTATTDWGTIYSFYIVDAASGGNVLYGADLSTPRPVAAGDTASFAAGNITLTES